MQRSYDKDPYAILGIPPTATASQVKQAYHRLARQYHPDLNNAPRAAEHMKDINWANDILSDPQERAFYDMWRRSSVRVEFQPGNASPRSNATPPRSSPPPPGTRGWTHSTPPPRTVYTTTRTTQDSWVQGCSPATIVIVIVLLMNAVRLFGSSSRSSYTYPIINVATQTAQVQRMVSVMETFCASQGNSNSCDTRLPSSLLETLLAPSPTATFTLPPIYETLPASPIATIQRDEYGREDLRPKMVPGSQEWEWIHYYFPDLTTQDGLSDEVTFVYWDQLRRAVMVETRQSGTFFVSIYGGNVTAGHYGSDTPAATATATPAP